MTVPVSERTRERVRLAAAGLVVLAVAFSVAPGRVVPDTKLDMPLNPGAFLSRALHMWDPSAYFGQVQNQAYGYLFPMGPFYLLGHLAHVPPWIIQRLWFTLVLGAAYYGVIALAGALKIGTPNTRLVAAFGYALAPRAEQLIGANSSEFLPMAVLPWILLPLVLAARGRLGPRRAAALSGLAVVCCGGINATAEAAVLVVPLLYLLTRRGGAARRRLTCWWLACTAAASLWWLGPAYLMGHYIMPFLPYTESATTTTSVTSLVNSLRGAAQWTGYLPVLSSPWWPAGHVLATEALPVLATTLVAAAGLYGLARRGTPERAFLVGCLLTGVALLVIGHPSSISAPFAGSLRDLLDGPLAAFRNVHKFDPLIRLPLVLGFCHALRVVRVPRRWSPPISAMPAWVGIAALVITVLPIFSPGLGPENSPVQIPTYEREAADWLNVRTGDGSVLAAPGQQFGQFTWGNVTDDPLEPLLSVKWATWTGVPYGSAGMGRLLQAIDQRFANGQGSSGLQQILARYGVKYLLVRNDVSRTVIGSAYPGRIHQAIAGTPGLTRIATFGPKVGDTGKTGLNQSFPALEIYRVASPAPAATTQTGTPLRVIGSPESLLTLADEGLLPPGRPVIFNDDSPRTAARTIVTDSLRRREVSFSEVRGGVTATMTAGQKYTGTSRTKDILDSGWSKYQTVAEYEGIKDVTASSSATDASALAATGSQADGPFSALDGDAQTSWISSGWNGGAGEWLQVRFDHPVDLSTISVAFDQSDLLGPAVRSVRITTDAGSRIDQVAKTRKAQTLATPQGTTSRLRITVTGLAGPSPAGTRVGISALTIPGVNPIRTLRVPTVSGAQGFAFTGSADATSDCMPGSATWVCTQFLGQPSEDGNTFDRTFTATAGQYTLTGRTAVTSPSLVAQYTKQQTGPQVSASSTLVDSPVASARSAFDGDPKTAWAAGSDDKNPTLTIDLDRTVTLDQLNFRFPGATKNVAAVKVQVVGSDGTSRFGLTDSKGVFRFATMTTDKLVITFTASPGIQISEVTVPGVEPITKAGTDPLTLACGTGPTFTLAGRTVRTAISGGSAADLLTGRAVSYTSCDSTPETVTGIQHLSATSSGFQIMQAVLSSTGPLPAAATDPVTIDHWDTQSRQVTVTGGDYLVSNENFDKGWTATLDGHKLTAIRLDGWRQAWVLPAGAHGKVTMEYAPNRAYVLLLVAGLALVVLLVVAAAVPERRRPVVLRPARPGRWLWPLLAAFGLWAGGPAGLVLVPACHWLARRRPRPAALSAALALALAGVLAAVNAWMNSRSGQQLPSVLRDAIPQLLCLAALGLATGWVRRSATATADAPPADSSPPPPAG